MTDLEAATAYVATQLFPHSAEFEWHKNALRDAYLAGVRNERERATKLVAKLALAARNNAMDCLNSDEEAILEAAADAYSLAAVSISGDQSCST